jgi:hypothetical protein
MNANKVDNADLEKRREALRARRADLQQQKAILAAEEEAKRKDPAAILAAEEEELEAEERAVKLKKREALADEAQREAIKKYGRTLVARIHTRDEGSIVMHAMPGSSLSDLQSRMAALPEDDRETLARKELRLLVDYPPLEELDDIIGRYPGIISSMVEARDALATNQATVTVGKG